MLQEVAEVAAVPAAAAGHHQHPAAPVAEPAEGQVDLLRHLVAHHALPLLFPGGLRRMRVFLL